MIVKEGSYTHGARHEDIDHIAPVTAVFSFDNIKFKIKGNLCLSKPINDFRYKEEIQLQVFSQSVITEARADNKGWNRSEIFLDLKDIDKLIEALI